MQTTISDERTDSKIRLALKVIDVLVNEGPESAFRRAVWKLHFKHFEQRTSSLGFRDGIPDVIRFLGHDFELHPSKRGVSEELHLFGVHEPVSTHEYLACLSLGDHVLDIGSNIGYYALLAADKVGPSGRVIGCEPASGVFEILERNVRRSDLTNIEVFPCAIGAQSGSLEFYESEIPNWGSVFQNNKLMQTRTSTVTAKTVDEIVGSISNFHPSAIRMDVEGAELLVLEGAREVLREYKPCLFIEFHNFALGWDKVRTAIAALADEGYSSASVIERTWDQPWMSAWMRARRCWSGPIDEMLARVESPDDSLVNSTLIFILRDRH
jgi:FkbM family methyltransferase